MNLIIFGLALLFCQAQAAGQTTVIQTTPAGYPSGIRLEVDPVGQINIVVPDGISDFSIPVGHELTVGPPQEGTDVLGAYRQVLFRYLSDGQRTAWVKLYLNHPLVLTGVRFEQDALNADPFPNFAPLRDDVMNFSAKDVWDHQFGYRSWLGQDSYWLFYNSRGNGAIFSPLKVMTARQSVTDDGTGSFASWPDPTQAIIPAGTVHETVLVFGRDIHSTYQVWGRSLSKLNGADRPILPNLDVKLEFFTDAGADYYYKRGNFKNMEDTAEQVTASFAAHSFVAPPYELDSFWYPKGNPGSWTKNTGFGAYVFEVDSTNPPVTGWMPFPTGLEALFGRQRARYPGFWQTLHIKYLDDSSPYRNFVDTDEPSVVGNFISSPKLWAQLAKNFAGKGARRIIQDWMSYIAPTLTPAQLELALTNQANAMAQQGIQLMYCMPLPSHVMFGGSALSSVTSVRISSDAFGRDKWDQALYYGQMADSLGLNRFVDNLDTNQPMDLIMAALHRSVIAVRNSVDTINWPNLHRSALLNGLIMMPDPNEAIRPLDQTYAAEYQERLSSPNTAYLPDEQVTTPMVAAAFTNQGNLRTAYLMVYARQPGQIVVPRVSSADLQISGNYYLYDYFAQTGQPYNFDGSAKSVLPVTADYNGKYLIAVPVGPSGIAFLGDLDRYVPLARQRITDLSDDGIVRATVSGAPGESQVTLSVYAESMPRVSVNGYPVRPTRDRTTGLYQVVAYPDGSGTAKIIMSISDGKRPKLPR